MSEPSAACFPFDILAFDADDTLWHNERLYAAAQERFRQLLGRYHEPAWIDEHLYQTEVRNLAHFGYGIKAFALSMIETALELTEQRICGDEIQVILDIARGMLEAEVELLDGVAATLAQLSGRCPLMLITKGDLRDQEVKLARSGLDRYFKQVEIVSDKHRANYEAILRRHAVPAGRFLMVGNSLRSDILPVLELGGSAVYIPYELTWTHEAADLPPEGQPGFYRLERFDQLPGLLARLAD